MKPVKIILSVFILGWLAFGAQQGALEAACNKEDMVSGTKFGNRITPGRSISNMPEVEESSARYLRFRLAQVSGPNEGYLVLRDRAKRSAQVIRPSDIADSGTLWTQRIKSDLVTFDIIPPLIGSGIKIIEYIAMPDEGENTFYSEVNRESKPVPLFENGTEAARRLGDGVGLVMSAFDNVSWCCSGIAVSPNLFLTNWHCGGITGMQPKDFWNEDIYQRTLIDFSWDGDEQSQEYQVVKVEEKSELLDYALLRIRPLNGAGPVHPAGIDVTESTAGSLRLIHHMACRTKLVSENCKVLNPAAPGRKPGSSPDRMYHDCSSNPGSSGAPLLNGKGDIIALHHDGQEVVDPSTCKTDHVNKAIRISSILKDIKTNNLAVFYEIHP